MTTINNLTGIDEVQAGDLLAVFVNSDGQARKAAISTIQDFMQENLTFGVSSFTTQYASPSSTGFSVQITDNTDDTHLILTPTATFATGTIVLPTNTVAVDKQQVLVNSTQIVTTLTIDGNGATVTGEPSTLAANDFFTLKFDKPNSVWFRVG
jgi:hypothetical protein